MSGMRASNENVYERFTQMKKMLWSVIWCSAIVLCLSTTGCRAKSDRDLIIGIWIDLSKDSSITDRWIIAADAMWSDVAKDGEGDRVGSGFEKVAYKLDSSKNPKEIDITLLEGDQKGRKFLGIYAFQGDTLMLCSSGEPGVRPTSFTAQNTRRYMLKREFP